MEKKLNIKELEGLERLERNAESWGVLTGPNAWKASAAEEDWKKYTESKTFYSIRDSIGLKYLGENIETIRSNLVAALLSPCPYIRRMAELIREEK